MTLARAARRPPRQIAELIVKHFPSLREVERVDVAGPGFLNVFLSPAWCTGALGEILEAGDAYGRGEGERGRRVRLEFVSANPTGPLVIVSARGRRRRLARASAARAGGAGHHRVLRQRRGHSVRGAGALVRGARRAGVRRARHAPRERLSWRVPDRARPGLPGGGSRAPGGRARARAARALRAVCRLADCRAAATDPARLRRRVRRVDVGTARRT